MRRTGGGSTGDIGAAAGGNGSGIGTTSSSGPVGSSKGKIGKIRKSLSRRLSLSRRSSSSSTPRERWPTAFRSVCIIVEAFASPRRLVFLPLSPRSRNLLPLFCDRWTNDMHSSLSQTHGRRGSRASRRPMHYMWFPRVRFIACL